MDAQFYTNVYHFTGELVTLLLEKFDGKVVGSDDMTHEIVMKELFGHFKPTSKPIKSGDGRKTAKKDEDIRVAWICEQVNTETELGKSIKYDYKEKFGLEILKVEKGGGNNDHYDILIYHTDGTKVQCEEKGTKKYCGNINGDTPAYENSVQFYNGPASKFTIPKKYLKLWYNINVNNSEIINKYDLHDIPTFEEWLEGGPDVIFGDPKSNFSITLKKNYRNIYPGKSMNSCGHNNIDYRIKVNESFEITEEEKIILIEEVQKQYNYIMGQKDVWLQTTGTIEGQFSFKWFDKIEPKKIINVELIKNKDIVFKFNFEDESYITGIMRWGNGCGFSCFRLDLK
tara:strand:+ start:89 stop:1114 length:1026 start_codon:yes stop_codon:yes gene_type:complete